VLVYYGRGSEGIFSLHHHIQTSSVAHLASYPVGTGVLTLRPEHLEHEADHTAPFGAMVRLLFPHTSLWYGV